MGAGNSLFFTVLYAVVDPDFYHVKDGFTGCLYTV